MEKKKDGLEKLYEQDNARRLDNTVKLLKEFALEEMSGEEQERFLSALLEERKNSPKKVRE